jgi:23S rRNA-/tRNA-specific pseudouridylate synthase
MRDMPPPRIVFADEAIVVVDKPSGMPSVPARTPLDPPAVAEAGPLALHAAGLAFDHPLTAEPFEFQAPPPAAAPWESFAAAISGALAAWPSG